jgi:hypothetical protein
MMISAFEDFTTEAEAFFNGLNWTYIMIYSFILYGVAHKIEFEWFNQLFKWKWWQSLKTWIAGLVVAVLFCFFKWWEGVEDTELVVNMPAYISTILRSWILVVVFNTAFSDRILRFDKKDNT